MLTEQFGINKSIILIMPYDSGITELIYKHLISYGFDVFFYQHKPYRYKNVYERIVNFFRKKIWGDNNYKQVQQGKIAIIELEKFIQKHSQKIDYALFIRGDMSSLELIQYVKDHTNYMVNYQWDGLDRFPSIFEKINFFDDFYVFDPMDMKKYADRTIILTTNFYFDIDNFPVSQSNKKIIYFIGAHLESRVKAINDFLRIANKHGLDTNFMIGGRPKNGVYKYPISIIKGGVKYQENLKYVQEANILIDFVNPLHNGLSFRVFEALYYRKKLITNNQDIINYDFYHPNNIFVWDGENMDEESLLDFLKKPCYDTPKEIVEFYSFYQWIRRILVIDSGK